MRFRSTIVVESFDSIACNSLSRIGGRPEIIIERPRPIIVGSPRPNVIVEQPRPVVVGQPVIGGLGGLLAGLGSALGSILTTDTDASQPEAPAQ
jgi:hypothetical protein